MTAPVPEHDPLCPELQAVAPGIVGYECQCSLIAKIRADEQDQMREQVQALPDRGLGTVLRDDVLALLDGGQP